MNMRVCRSISALVLVLGAPGESVHDDLEIHVEGKEARDVPREDIETPDIGGKIEILPEMK